MQGVVGMFDGRGLYAYGAMAVWCRANFRNVAFSPEQIVAAAAEWPEWDDPSDLAGIYFLIRGGKVCYVGKATCLSARIGQHKRRNRPFEKVTVIAGLPPPSVGEFEAAYLRAWDPPWNVARPAGYASWVRDLTATLKAMPQDLICDQPERAPVRQAPDPDIDVLAILNALGF